MLVGIAGAQNPIPTARATFFESVQSLSIEPGLKLLIDAGDGLSYPGSGQIVTDRSGTGNMVLGTTSGVDSEDMAWSGVADRRSGAEYFYNSSGSPQFVGMPLGTKPAWIDAIHQDNAKFAIAGWHYAIPVPTTGGALILDTQDTYAGIGFSLAAAINAVPNAGKLVLAVANGSGGAVAEVYSSGLVPVHQWSYFAIVVDEAAGTYSMWVNGSQTNGAITYASPSGSAATYEMIWGNRALNSSLSNLAMWQGTTPTAAQLGALFQATRDKFGI